MIRGLIFIFVNILVVDTLKFKYVSTFGEGGLKMLVIFFFGMLFVG